MIELVSKHHNLAIQKRQIGIDDLRMASDEILLVEKPTSDELNALAEKFKLERGNLEDVLDIDEAPRLDHDTHHGYLYVRFPYAHRDGSTTTRPLLFVYSENELIMIFPTRPEETFNSLAKIDSSFSTRSPQAAMLWILYNIFVDYDTYIKGQSQAIKNIITKMRTRKLENEDFVRFVLMEDQINNFRSSLAPTVPMLRRLAVSKYFHLTNGQRDLLDDIILAVEQSIHVCDTNSARIVSIREAYATLSNNSLNRTMKTLTLATLMLAAPNLIFGMYGMNVSLPFQHDHWGYYFTLSLAIILIILMMIWARRRRLF